MAGELLLQRDYAACICGCGWMPSLSDRTNVRHGLTKGEPLRMIPAHLPRVVGHHHQRRARERQPDQGRSGYCGCGCGERTRISTKTIKSQQEFIGQPKRFLKGHWRKLLSKELRRQREREQEAQRRAICTVCFASVPLITTINNVCACCLVRKQRQQAIDQQLQASARERDRRRRDGARRSHETIRANGGYKHMLMPSIKF